jgi:hypothetical protein
MNKTLFLISVNIIVLPIIINFIFTSRLYGSKGLAGIVFDYHISALGVSLVLKLIDPLTLVMKISLAIKYIRNWIIKFKYKKNS